MLTFIPALPQPDGDPRRPAAPKDGARERDGRAELGLRQTKPGSEAAGLYGTLDGGADVGTTVELPYLPEINGHSHRTHDTARWQTRGVTL